jgi:hypothetical protein
VRLSPIGGATKIPHRKSFKEMVMNIGKQSPRENLQQVREMNFKEVLDFMHARPCLKNIKRYQEELVDLRSQYGTGNRKISHGRLQQERNELIKRTKPMASQLAYKHRLLNSYVQLYRERLSLANTKAEFQASLNVPLKQQGQAHPSNNTLLIDFE